MVETNKVDSGSIIEVRKRHPFLIRSISVFLALTISYQQVALAQTVKPMWAESRPSQNNIQPNHVTKSVFGIPHQLANTIEYSATDGAETIINIQDAHASLPAQYSIVDLLDSLAANCDLRFVALEGASGRIDTSILRSLPDKSIRKDTADYLMREGLMSAGEFFAATRDIDNVSLFGAEEEALYNMNVESFRSVAADRAAIIAEIDKLLGELSLLGDKVYSVDLANFSRKSFAHHDGALSFSEYWKAIEVFTNRYGIDTSIYGELAKLLESIKVEKVIDFAKANAERQRLMDEIAKACKDRARLEELVSKSVAFKQNKLSPAEFHGYLIALAEKMSISPAGYANLIMFTKYVTIYESMEILGLYRDIEGLEEKIRGRLFRSEDEKGLYRLATAARLLKRLYSMEFNNREFTYFREHYGNLKAEEFSKFISKKCGQYDLSPRGGYDLGRIVGGIANAVKFYSDAEARNSAIFTNTINRMRKEGKRVGALITGGYHAEGLTELMKAKRLSYLVVMPKFKNGETRPYVAILTNKKAAYEKLLESGRYHLAASVFFDVKGDINRLKPMVLHALDEALNQGGEELFNSVRSEWTDDYRRVYGRAPEARLKDDAANEITPDEFREYLNRFKAAPSKDGKAEVVEDAGIAEVAPPSLAFTVSKAGTPSLVRQFAGMDREMFHLVRRVDTKSGDAASDDESPKGVFYEMLLGPAYAQMFLGNEANLICLSPKAREIVADVEASLNNRNTGPRKLGTFWVRFRERLVDENGQPLPIYVFLRTESGETVRLEYNVDVKDREFIDYWDTQALMAEGLSDYTAMLLLNGMLRRGGDLEAFQQSSANSTFKGEKAIREPELIPTLRCLTCMECIKSCGFFNMAALQANDSPGVLVKTIEDGCNGCNLCTQCPDHKSIITGRSLDADKDDNIYAGGEVRYLSGGDAVEFYNTLVKQLDGKEKALWRDLELENVYEGGSIEAGTDGNPLYEKVVQIKIMSKTRGVKPWLVTALGDPKDAGAGFTIIERPFAEALIPITTKSGEVEIAMAGRAQLMGARIRGVYMPGTRYGGSHPAIKLFEKNKMLSQDNMIDLATASPSFVLSPMLEEIPIDVQSYYTEKAGTLMHLMAPLPLQAGHPTQDSLISSLQRELFSIFADEKLGKELRMNEQAKAKKLLDRLMGGDKTVEAEIMARYGRWVVSAGSTMCPGCLQHQVYSAPILMAILTSLSHGEVPIIVDSKTTSCWSENNMRLMPAEMRGGTSAKVPTNRTTYGAQPSSAEVISMSWDKAVEAGYIAPQTLYAAAGSGDGGAYIGWDSQGNMARAFGRLIRRKHSHVQVAVILVDNQAYANTGGEASASSVAGGAAKTSPLGKGGKSSILTLGVSYLPLAVEDMVSQMPGWFVGAGTSSDIGIIYRHYARAYMMRRPSFYKALTPCIDINRWPSGVNANRMNDWWEQAGLAPTYEYVGRFMKRLKPKEYSEDEEMVDGVPRSIHELITHDPRYRAYWSYAGGQVKISDDAIVRLEIAGLVRLRRWANWWLDFGNPIAEQAERYTDGFFRKVEDEYRANPNSRYGHLFDSETGALKAEFGDGLRRDFLEAIVGVDFIRSFSAKKEEMQGSLTRPLEEYEGLIARIEECRELLAGLKKSSKEGTSEYAEAERSLEEALEKAGNALKTMSEVRGVSELTRNNPNPSNASERDRLYESVFGGRAFDELIRREEAAKIAKAQGEDVRETYFRDVFDGILNDLGLAKIAALTSRARLQDVKADFYKNGGLVTEKSSFVQPPKDESEDRNRREYRKGLARIDDYVVRVLSVSGFGGITINKVKQALDRRRGAFTQVEMDFKSPRRFDAVDAGTNTSRRLITEKDWLKAKTAKAVIVPEHVYTKKSVLRYVRRLDPFGMLIVNDPGKPEEVRAGLVSHLKARYQEVIARIRELPLENKKDLERLRNTVSQDLYGKNYLYLNNLIGRFAGKSEQDFVDELICLAKVHIVTVDADGIMKEVGLNPNENQHNLIVNSLFYHLDGYLGLPVSMDAELPLLRSHILRIVKKNDVADKYIEAIKIAYERSKEWVPKKPDSPEELALYPLLRDEADIDPKEYENGVEGLFPIESGGQALALAASQLCTEDFPGYYIGFPITPSSYFFWTFATIAANGHPYILSVDENNLSEMVAGRKFLMAAKTGLAMIWNATSSQGDRHYGEIMPLAVGMRVPLVLVDTGRALSAPNLSIKSSQEDVLTFEKDGPIILIAKNNKEAVFMTYLAKALALTLSYPVRVYQEGFTDSHRTEDIPYLTDKEVRAWDAFLFEHFDYLRGSIFNKQGEILVPGASSDSETYMEGRAVAEQVLEAARYIYPYLAHTLESISERPLRKPYRFKVVEIYPHGEDSLARHRVVTMGGRSPNFERAIDILSERGHSGLYSLIRPVVYTPFPDREIAAAFGWDPDKGDRDVSGGLALVFDMAGDPSRPAPLAQKINNVSSRYFTGGRTPKVVSLRAGESSRPILPENLADYMLFMSLIAGDEPEEFERQFVDAVVNGGADKYPEYAEERLAIDALIESLVAEKRGTISREISLPPFVPMAQLEVEMRDELMSSLGKKDYAGMLTRIYGRVSFFEINELYDQTITHFRLLIELEILGARHFLRRGAELGLALSDEKRLRYALLLLEYSQGREDHGLAAGTLNSILSERETDVSRQAANLLRKNAKYQAIIEDSGVSVIIPEGRHAAAQSEARIQPQQPSDAERVIPKGIRDAIAKELAEAMKKNPYPDPESIPYEKEEVGRLERAILDAAAESRFEPLNPVDIERLAMARLAMDGASQLFGKEVFGRGKDRLYVEAYRLRYGNEIGVFLARATIPANFAPELNTVFGESGIGDLRRLIMASIRLRAAAGNGLPEEQKEIESFYTEVESDLEAYLEEVVYPSFERNPAIVKKPRNFYTNYYYLGESDRMRREVEDLFKKAREANGASNNLRALPGAKSIDFDSPEGIAGYRRHLEFIVRNSRAAGAAENERDAALERHIDELFSEGHEGADINLFEALASGPFDRDRVRAIIDGWLKTAAGLELMVELKACLSSARERASEREVARIASWITANYDLSMVRRNEIEAMVRAEIARSVERDPILRKAKEKAESASAEPIVSGEFELLARDELSGARMQVMDNGRTREDNLIENVGFFDTEDVNLRFWTELFRFQEGIIAGDEDIVKDLDARYEEGKKKLSIAGSQPSSKQGFLIHDPQDLIIFIDLALKNGYSLSDIENVLKGKVLGFLRAEDLRCALRLVVERFELGGLDRFSRVIQSRKIVALKDLQLLVIACMAYSPELISTMGSNDPAIGRTGLTWIFPAPARSNGSRPEWNDILDGLAAIGFEIKRSGAVEYSTEMIGLEEHDSYLKIDSAGGFAMLKRDLLGANLTGDMETDLGSGGVDRWRRLRAKVAVSVEDLMGGKARCDAGNKNVPQLPEKGASQRVVRYLVAAELSRLTLDDLRSIDFDELSNLAYNDLLKRFDRSFSEAVNKAPILVRGGGVAKGREEYGYANIKELQNDIQRTLLRYLSVLIRTAHGASISNFDDLDIVTRYESAKYMASLSWKVEDVKMIPDSIANIINGRYDTRSIRDDCQALRFIDVVSTSLGTGAKLLALEERAGAGRGQPGIYGEKILREQAAYLYRKAAAANDTSRSAAGGKLSLGGADERLRTLNGIVAAMILPEGMRRQNVSREAKGEVLGILRRSDLVMIREPGDRPVIESREDLKALIKCFISSLAGRREWESSRAAHKFAEMERWVTERLSRFIIDPGLLYPGGMTGTILEVVENVTSGPVEGWKEAGAEIERILSMTAQNGPLDCRRCGQVSCALYARHVARGELDPREIPCVTLRSADMEDILMLFVDMYSDNGNGHGGISLSKDEWKAVLKYVLVEEHLAQLGLRRSLDRGGDGAAAGSSDVADSAVVVSADAFRDGLMSLGGMRAYSKISDDEREFLCGYGKYALELRRKNFDEGGNPVLRENRRNEPVLASRARQVETRARAVYGHVESIDELDDEDRALLLERRRVETETLLREDFAKAYAYERNPGQIESMDEFLVMLEVEFLRSLKLPLILDVKSRLPDNKDDLLKQHIAEIDKRKRDTEKEGTDLAAKIIFSKVHDDRRVSSQEALRVVIGRFVTKVQSEKGLRYDGDSEEITKESLTESVFKEFNRSGVWLDPGLRFGWLYLESGIQGYLEAPEGLKRAGDSLAKFRGSDQQAWSQLDTALKEAMLKAFIAREVDNFVRGMRTKPAASPRSDEDILDEVIMRRVVAHVKKALLVTRGISPAEEDHTGLIKALDAIISGSGLVDVPGIAELRKGVMERIAKRSGSLSADMRAMPYYSPAGKVNLMLMAVMENYSGQRYTERDLGRKLIHDIGGIKDSEVEAFVGFIRNPHIAKFLEERGGLSGLARIHDDSISEFVKSRDDDNENGGPAPISIDGIDNAALDSLSRRFFEAERESVSTSVRILRGLQEKNGTTPYDETRGYAETLRRIGASFRVILGVESDNYPELGYAEDGLWMISATADPKEDAEKGRRLDSLRRIRQEALRYVYKESELLLRKVFGEEISSFEDELFDYYLSRRITNRFGLDEEPVQGLPPVVKAAAALRARIQPDRDDEYRFMAAQEVAREGGGPMMRSRLVEARESLAASEKLFFDAVTAREPEIAGALQLIDSERPSRAQGADRSKTSSFLQLNRRVDLDQGMGEEERIRFSMSHFVTKPIRGGEDVGASHYWKEFHSPGRRLRGRFFITGSIASEIKSMLGRYCAALEKSANMPPGVKDKDHLAAILEDNLRLSLDAVKNWNGKYELGLEHIELTVNSPHAGLLTSRGKVINIAVESLIDPRISIDFVLDDLLTHAVIRDEPQDSRIPVEFCALAEEIAASWHTLTRVKLLQSHDGKLYEDLVRLFEWFGDRNILDLLNKLISRDDLSERDEVFPWIIDHIKRQKDIYEELQDDVNKLERIKAEDYERYERIVDGMISEARANTGKLPKVRRAVQLESTKEPSSDPKELWRRIVSNMGRIANDNFDIDAHLENFAELSVSEIWGEMVGMYKVQLRDNLAERLWGDKIRADRFIGDKVAQFNDSYEIAAMLLFSEMAIPEAPENKRFIQYLVENEAAYNQLLAASYSSEEGKLRALDKALNDYNRRPENYGKKPVEYSLELKKVLVKAVYLRPDVVKDTIRREYAKNIYKGLPMAGLAATKGTVKAEEMGLFKNISALHSVLHRLQAIFGFITPEVLERIAKVADVKTGDEYDGLGIAEEFIVNTIIFYPRFNTSPAGDIELRVCRYGGACIIAGAAKITDEVREELKKLALSNDEINDIQVHLDACLGVCYRAPVMMVFDRRSGKSSFVGPLAQGEMAGLITELTSLPSYPQKQELFRAAARGLTPGRGFLVSNEHRVVSASPQDDQSAVGRIATIDYEGNVYLVPEEEIGNPFVKDKMAAYKAGTLIPERIVSFEYTALRNGKPAVATLVLSDQLVLRDVIGYDADPTLGGRLGTAVGLRVELDEKTQELRIEREERPLGRVNSHTIAIRRDSGEIAAFTLNGNNEPITLKPYQPEQVDMLAKEPSEFVKDQDRLVFKDARVDPAWDADYALEAGFLDPVLDLLRVNRDLMPLDERGDPANDEKAWRPWSQEEIFSLTSAGQLQGRGGAFFPTIAKWELIKRTIDDAVNRSPAEGEGGGPVRYDIAPGLIVMVESGKARVVINADEGDPQAFRDRLILQYYPYKLIAGAAIIAIALGIKDVDIFTRDEYKEAAKVLDRAIHQARGKGWLGKDIYGRRGLDVDIEIRYGSGNFLSGEERALLENDAGYRGLPERTPRTGDRTRRARRLVSRGGIYERGPGGKRAPTMVQNVTTTVLVGELMKLAGAGAREKLKANGGADIAGVIRDSIKEAGDRFVAMGYGGTGGPIAITTSGDAVTYQGVVETGLVTLRSLHEISGGTKPGRDVFAAQFAGPAGELVKFSPDAFTEVGGGLMSEDWAWFFDHELTPVTLSIFNWIMGSGAIGFAGRKVNLLDFVSTYTRWLGKESCGQCPGCANPAHVMVARLKKMQTGNAASSDIWAIRDLAEQARRQNVECGLGANLPNPVTSSLRSVPVDYLYEILRNWETDRVELLESISALNLGDKETFYLLRNADGSDKWLSDREFSRQIALLKTAKNDVETAQMIDSIVGAKKVFNINGHYIKYVIQRLSEIDAVKSADERVLSRFLRLMGLIPPNMKPENVELDRLDLKGRRFEIDLKPKEMEDTKSLYREMFKVSDVAVTPSVSFSTPSVSPSADDTPPSSRGKSGLSDVIYTEPIARAIADSNFSAVRFTVKDGLEGTSLRRDEDGLEVLGRWFTHDQRETLSKAVALLSDEDRRNLDGSIMLFINGLDDAVNKAQKEKAAQEGRAPPADCYGTHYGIFRSQYYIDISHLDGPIDLAFHLRHEIRERTAVLNGLADEEKRIPANKRSTDLQAKINSLSTTAHNTILLQEEALLKLADRLREHMLRIKMDDSNRKTTEDILGPLADAVDYRKSLDEFMEDFRVVVMPHLQVEWPNDILGIWDEVDRLGLTPDDLKLINEMISRDLAQTKKVLELAIDEDTRSAILELPISDEDKRKITALTSVGEQSDKSTAHRQYIFQIETKIPPRMVSRNLLLYQIRALDGRLKKLVRERVPKSAITDVESDLRSLALDEKGINFLISFINSKDQTSPRFWAAIALIRSICSDSVNPDIETKLNSRKASSEKMVEAYNEHERHKREPGFIIHDMNIMRGSMLNPKKAMEEIALIDYILGLDEESALSTFDQSVFATEKTFFKNDDILEKSRRYVPRTGERTRTINDYAKMYLNIYPISKEEKRAAETGLIVIGKLCMFLREFGLCMKELEQRLGEGDAQFKSQILTPRLVAIGHAQIAINALYEEAEKLCSEGKHGDAIRRITELLSDINFKMADYSYPTQITKDFTSVVVKMASVPGIPMLLSRLNDIDFDSSMLVNFMVPIFEPRGRYPSIEYPYVHYFADVRGVDGMDDPWGLFKSQFLAEEGIDISGIERIYPNGSMRMDIVACGDTIDLLIYELFKNAVTYARVDSTQQDSEGRKIKRLVGVIREDFIEDADGYRYSIEGDNDGISHDRLRKIFNVSESTGVTYKKFAGAGVGLAKVKNIVDMYGGKIRLVSRIKGRNAYELIYENGEFKNRGNAKRLSREESDRILGSKTGTKFIITFPHQSGEDFDRVKGVLSSEKKLFDGESRPSTSVDTVVSESEFNVVIGMPNAVMNKSHLTYDKLRKMDGIDIISLESQSRNDMIHELNRKTRDKRSIAVLLDIEEDKAVSYEDMKRIMTELKNQVIRNVVELTNPEIASLTYEEVKQRLKDTEARALKSGLGISGADKAVRDELINILGVYVRLLPQGVSYELSQKSIYEIRMNKLYNVNKEDYSDSLNSYLMGDIQKEDTKRYMATAVESAFDLKMLAQAINERRKKMNADKAKDPIMDYVIVRAEVIKDLSGGSSASNKIAAILETVGLDLDADRVIIVGEGSTITPEDILREIGDRSGETVKNNQVAIGETAGIIDVDIDNPGDLFTGEDSLLFVRLDGTGQGLASQLYHAMLEITASGGQVVQLGQGSLRQIGVFRFFIYLPKTKEINFKAEAESYRRYITEVLIKA